MYRNSTEAFYFSLERMTREGQKIRVRDQEIIELLSQNLIIVKPWEKVVVIPHRENNIFSTIAETFWVIAGRNDLEFLSRYLPNAPDFSDDGSVWRAGYGVRLRSWAGQVDQFKEVFNILLNDRNSRRAVMTIFNPSEDFIESKDIPCNNWLHFIIRRNKLHMNIGVRSNDIVWGFSGINTFEWGVLQEMLACWTGSEIGSSNYLIGSFHLYERHFERASKILGNRREKSLYDFGFKNLSYHLQFHELDNALAVWFEGESKMRRERVEIGEISQGINDEFLKYSLHMIYIYNRFLMGAEQKEIFSLIMDLPLSDYRVAAYEYFSRKYKVRELSILSSQEIDFFKYYWGI